VFVARRGGSDEGDGYVLATIFEERRNASHLAIFDARRIDDGPLARAYLDHRVPLGFHGSWREEGQSAG
jgi:all-trans-8'-apo-beta-carotenal 15,15'-oxygenase